MKAKGYGMEFETNKWAQLLAKDYAQYEFYTGVLEDKPERIPKYGNKKSFHGGQALKKGKKSDTMVSEVAKKFDEIYNWLMGAWSGSGRNANNRDILNVIAEYSRFLGNPQSRNRLRNTVQAVVRNPILRGDYGDNSEATAEKKGFNRLMIATGTFFDNIKALVIRRGR